MFRILRNIDLNLLTIFEAVYVHKGIVNAAKILNITPSAISQSINKLRALFPDPLFIRKGQGVTPTAYATHLHQYISRGMEAFLSALDITGSPHQQRVITIATTPAMGALLLPEGQRYPTLHRRLQEEMGERRCGFSTFNLMTQAAMIAGSDMLGLTTERLFAMVSRLWPLQTLDFPSLGEEQIDVALHFNKLSGKEPLLKEIIETVIRSFKA